MITIYLPARSLWKLAFGGFDGRWVHFWGRVSSPASSDTSTSPTMPCPGAGGHNLKEAVTTMWSEAIDLSFFSAKALSFKGSMKSRRSLVLWQAASQLPDDALSWRPRPRTHLLHRVPAQYVDKIFLCYIATIFRGTRSSIHWQTIISNILLVYCLMIHLSWRLYWKYPEISQDIEMIYENI